MFLVAQELCVFFGFSSSPSITCSASFSASTFLRSSGFGILVVDLGHDVSDFRVRISLNKVPEQIGKAKKVTKSSNCIIFLFKRKKKAKLLVSTAILGGHRLVNDYLGGGANL
jgi:hypothetical protein